MKPQIHIDEKRKQDIRRDVIADVNTRSKKRPAVWLGSLAGAGIALAALVFVFVMPSLVTETQNDSGEKASYTSFAQRYGHDFLADTENRRVAYQRVTKKRTPTYLKYRSRLDR